MDLEARSRAFVEAMGEFDGETLMGFFASDVVCEFPGILRLEGQGQLQAFVETVRGNLAALGVQGIAVKLLRVGAEGRTSFAEWDCTMQRAAGNTQTKGVHVLSWDADGRIANSTVYTDGEAVRRVAVGIGARKQAGAAGAEQGIVDTPPALQ